MSCLKSQISESSQKAKWYRLTMAELISLFLHDPLAAEVSHESLIRWFQQQVSENRIVVRAIRTYMRSWFLMCPAITSKYSNHHYNIISHQFHHLLFIPFSDFLMSTSCNRNGFFSGNASIIKETFFWRFEDEILVERYKKIR